MRCQHGVFGTDEAAAASPIVSMAHAEAAIGAEPASSTDSSEQQHSGAIAVCVAILAGLGLTALLRMLPRPGWGYFVRRHRLRHLVQVMPGRRPPALRRTQLCLLRC